MMMNHYYDIAIVGSGPAGTAAAIHAALKGLNVALIESYQKSRPQPGESLPPGIEAIFRQLGIWNTIRKLDLIRNNGHYTWCEGDKEKIFHPYGSDKHGEWRGFQIPRNLLNTILQNRALELGVTLFPKCHIKNLVLLNKKITSLSYVNNTIHANYYIDATGGCHLFARNLGIEIIKYSSTLIARYGYLTHDCPHHKTPIFVNDKKGWSWYAKIDHQLYAWVRVEKNSEEKSNEIHKAYGGAEVTWRMAKQLAGPGFFLVGDAACVLDPSAGHGVLRAMMTGIMAANTIFNLTENIILPQEAYSRYNFWLSSWFKNDMNELKARLLQQVKMKHLKE